MFRSRTLIACLSMLLVFGCGSDVYESRLAETNAFFQYRQSLDRVLQNGHWNSPTSVSMRIPKGFNLLPAPRPVKEGETAPEDSRQPFYLGVQLPGLIGAWQGEFPCDNGTRSAFLYVCSNHQAYLDLVKAPEGPNPELFLSDLESALSGALQVQLPPGEVSGIGNNIRYAQTCPADGKYALQRKFTGVAFVPPGVLPNMDVEIRGQLYEHYNGKIQVAVLAIYPAAIREPLGEKPLGEKLLTALETFSVSSEVPKVKAGGPTGAGGAGKSGF